MGGKRGGVPLTVPSESPTTPHHFRRPPVRLTKSFVDRCTTVATREFHWDNEVKGLAVVIYPPSVRDPKGTKSYVLRYITHSGRDRLMKLGRHGVLVPETARKLARKVLHEVAEGRDPMEERRKLRAALTVQQVWDSYTTEKLAKKKPSTRKEVERIAETVILPALGSMKAADVQRSDVQRIHGCYTDRPYAGNRVLAWLSGLLTYAEHLEARTPGSNPCRFVEPYKEEIRDDRLELEDLAKFGAALRALEEKGPRYQAQADAVRLLLLLGARKGEVLGLSWHEISFDRRLIDHADTKGGAMVRGLGAAALEILKRRQQATGKSPWVFPSPRNAGKPITDLRRFLEDAWKRAGLDPIPLHGLRHTFATRAGAIGFSDTMVGELLGHRKKTVTAGYQHLEKETRAAAEKVQSDLWTALNRPVEGDVVSIGRATK